MTDEYHAEQTLKQLAAMLGVDGNLYRDLPLAVRALQVSERDAMANVRHWKANHDNMVSRCALLSQREDLPVDRIPAHEELVKLQKEVSEWRKLKDPIVLHINLLRGIPARLTQDMLRHIAGDFNEAQKEINAALDRADAEDKARYPDAD